MQNHLYLLDSNFEIRRSLFAIVQGAVPATYFIVFSFLPVSQSSAVGSWSIQNVVQMASILLMFISLFVCVVLLITHHRISVIGTTIYHSLRRSSNVVGPVRWSGVSIIFFVLSVSTFHLGLFGWMLAEGARLLEYVIIAVVDPIITVVIIIAVQASANQNKIDSLYSGQETEHDVSRVANDLNNHAGLSLRNTVRDIYVVLVLSLAMYVATLAAIGQVGAIQMAGQLPLTDGAYNDWSATACLRRICLLSSVANDSCQSTLLV